MNDVIQIPEEYTFTIKRMINGLPEPLREDPVTLRTLMAFFKLGGKSLAQQWVDVKNAHFEERVVLSRRKAFSESDLDDDLGDEGVDEDLDIDDELEQEEEEEDPLGQD
jgi:hypothetical protein